MDIFRRSRGKCGIVCGHCKLSLFASHNFTEEVLEFNIFVFLILCQDYVSDFCYHLIGLSRKP